MHSRNNWKGRIYPFLKEGQRNYWLFGDIALLETEEGRLSRPLAAIKILESTHFLKEDKVYTKGKYKVTYIPTEKDEIIFNWMARRKNE